MTADEKFEQASRLQLPPFLWIPPEKPPLLPTDNRRGPFRWKIGEIHQMCQSLENRGFEKFPGQEQPDPGALLTMIPDPASDFRHNDPAPRDSAGGASGPGGPNFARLKAKLSPADLDELRDLNYLERTAGPNAPGYQRLKLAFHLILCRTQTILSAINEAVKDPTLDYDEARKAYLAFIGNLDDREPETKKGGVDPRKGFGYGRNIQWAYIEPIIEPVLVPTQQDPTKKTQLDLITGATLVVKWNPHSSSSGIPISH